MRTKTVSAFVDRLEGEIAVVLIGEMCLVANLPAECLPDGAGEGSGLTISIKLDSGAARYVGERIIYDTERFQRGD